VINGVCWATRNVDMPGTFAENPEAAGMFYQWNRKMGWSSTDPMVNSDGETIWDASDSEGDTWEKVNDPCPAGWRVPTRNEQVSLSEVSSYWTEINGVHGQIFGTGSQTLFLPAAGHRDYSYGSRFNVGTDGRYWSSSTYSTIDAYYLTFNGSTVYTDYSLFRARGFSVRCVAE